MNKFLKRIVIFALFPVCYFGLNGIINYNIYSNSDCQIGKSEILIVGDSHSQFAINPSLLNSAQNISQPAEPYILTFWKLKKFFKHSHPSTILIGFSPHNISGFNDLKFTEKRWSADLFKRSYTIEEFGEIESIKIDYPKFYKEVWKQTCFYPKANHCYYIGEHPNSKKSNLRNADNVIKTQFYFEDIQLGISETSIDFLDSIISLCKSHNARPIFIRPPEHNSYTSKIPKEVIYRFEELKSKMNSSGLEVFDYASMVFPDSLYYNPNHLNRGGANIFTREIEDNLKL